MSKGRRTHGDKELNELQRARKTIDKLKRENSSLRKQLDRALSSERLADLQDLVRRQRQEELELEKIAKKSQRDKEKWRCHKCGAGAMKITLWPRLDGVFYNRACSNIECDNKTRMKKYNPETVDGILDQKEKEKIE
jgi:hypothetical protein